MKVSKHLPTILLIVILTLFFSSCAANHSRDTYYLHALSFSLDGGGIKLSAILEKQGAKGDDNEYFVADGKGKNLEDALDNFFDKYSRCYFASNELYLLPKELDSTLISHLYPICESSRLPCCCRVLCVDENELSAILQKIKSEDDIKRILKLSKGTSPVFSVYIARLLSKQDDSIGTALLYLDDGKIDVKKATLFASGESFHLQEEVG